MRKQFAQLAFLAVLASIPYATTIRNSAAQAAQPPRSTWWVAYEHDASGNAVDGDLQTLIDAVANGSDIKVSSGDVFYLPNRVRIRPIGGTTHVAFETENVSLLSSYGPPAIKNPPYFGHSSFDTSGGYALARASIYNGSDLGKTVSTLGAKWWVRY